MPHGPPWSKAKSNRRRAVAVDAAKIERESGIGVWIRVIGQRCEARCVCCALITRERTERRKCRKNRDDRISEVVRKHWLECFSVQWSNGRSLSVQFTTRSSQSTSATLSCCHH